MMWIRQLMPATVHLYGPGRALIIYTLSSVTGFAFSSGAIFLPRFLLGIMGVGPSTLGASAALFGLMGALIHYSRRTGHSALGQQVWGWAILLFVFGLVMRGVDNWAHLGGFLGGYAVARWLDPLRPERGDHLIAGLACLAATAVAIGASIIHGLRYF
jgi:rhomboid protease GluP